MPERPPKAWFYRTVRSLSRISEVDDPEALAGWIWHQHARPETKRAIIAGAESRRKRFDIRRIKERVKQFKVRRRYEPQLPEPIDIYGYDHTVVRIVPEIDNLLEVNVRMPEAQWSEIKDILEGSEDTEIDEERGRIVRRGKNNEATNIFIDRE